MHNVARETSLFFVSDGYSWKYPLINMSHIKPPTCHISDVAIYK